MRNTLETTRRPGAVRMNSNAGRIVCAVVCAAPETIPSASPWIIMVPKYDASPIWSNAWSAVTPLCRRSAW